MDNAVLARRAGLPLNFKTLNTTVDDLAVILGYIEKC